MAAGDAEAGRQAPYTTRLREDKEKEKNHG
jgi:hypothetical protein